VARPSLEEEYRTMTSTTSELIWVKQLLVDVGIKTQYNENILRELSRKIYCIESHFSWANKTHWGGLPFYSRKKSNQTQLRLRKSWMEINWSICLRKDWTREYLKEIIASWGWSISITPNLRGSVENNN
jgi:hypothetical protein